MSRALSVLFVASVASAAPPCTGPAAASGAWYRDAVFYEVFVRSFQDSDGDGIGDLNGLTSRLDYLQDLGVTALWLMPIFESPSYHGYDTTNYCAIDRDYGTLADFERLAAEAKKRGIRLVLDLVMNHSSNRHPWFVKGKRGPGHPHHDWFVWGRSAPKWGRPWDSNAEVWHRVGDTDRYYYGLFWGGMPDLNWANPKVEAEFTDIAWYWLDRGAAGFRLDAARYLVENGGGKQQADQPETHAIWRRLRAALSKNHPDVLLVGEVWTDLKTTATYFGADGKDELNMLFDFDRMNALRTGLEDGDAAPLQKALCGALEAQPRTGKASYGTFVTNHDLHRQANDLTDPRQQRLAAGLLLTLPGVPFVYYGEELGLADGPGEGDIAKRAPMRWDDTAHYGFSTAAPWTSPEGERNKAVASASQQSRDPGSLRSHYRRLIHLRRRSPALSRGATTVLRLAHEGGSPLAWVRHTGDDKERVVVVANLSAQPSRNVRDPVKTVHVSTLLPYELKIFDTDGKPLE